MAQFDNSVSLGSIIGYAVTILLAAFGAIGGWIVFAARKNTDFTVLTQVVTQLTTDIKDLKDTIKILAEQTIRTALLEQEKVHQNERIARLERVVEEMQHGEGYVLPLHGRNKSAFGEGS